jgi:hypothetical protein
LCPGEEKLVTESLVRGFSLTVLVKKCIAALLLEAAGVTQVAIRCERWWEMIEESGREVIAKY